MKKFSFRTAGKVTLAAVAAVFFFTGVKSVSAAVTVTAATGGSAIGANTNTTNGSSTWTTLTGPTVTETTGRAISTGSGTIVLTAPSGFSYNTSTSVTATITRDAGSSTCFTFSSNTATPATSSITYTITARDGNGSTQCHVTFSNIQARPTAGTPLASGNITNTGSNAQVPSGAGNSYGTLTEIAGPKNKLIYTTQPPTAATTSVNFATDPVITLEDLYGNTESSDSASTVGLAVVLSTQACGGTAGSGTLTSTPASGAAVTAGVMTYTAMQYSTAQSIKVCATSSGVTSALSNAITVNAPPVPTITSLSATSTIAGTSAFTLTVNGTNYSASSTVDWNGSARTTTFVSASQLTAAINAADIASVGAEPVTVVDPVGGTSGSQTFTVTAMPSSLIVFKSATSTSLNGTATTITVNKPAGVVQGDTEVAMISYRPNTETLTAPAGWVLENNQGNTFNDADGLATYVLLAGASEPASYTWTLSAGSTGSAGAIEDFSGVSPTVPVNVVSSSALLSNSYVQSTPSVTTNISGAMLIAGYADSNADSWYGVFSMVQDIDASSAAVPNAVGESLAVNRVVQASAGATGVFTNIVSSQSDASDAGEAVVLALQPGHAVPTTTSISPASTTAGGAQFTLTVNGTGFDSSSTVDWNGSPLVTTYVSYTQVTAIVPAADIATGGTASVTVVNPAPGGGTSNAQTFTINNPVPTTSSISPTSTTAGGSAFTLTVTGTNFTASSTIDFNGSPLATTFISSTTISVTIPSSSIAVGGTDSITVVNPAPGGGTSGAQTLTVKNPVPTTTSISPTSTTAGGAQFTLTVNGTNFNASSIVDFNGSGRATTFISSTTVTAIITAADISLGGTASVTVVNPAPGGGTSNAQTFTINNPVPATSSVSPTSTTAGGPSFTLTVTGTNFNASSTIDFNGVPFTTIFISSTTITITVPSSSIVVGGTDSITVVNPGPGGGTSGAQTLTVKNPVPTTTSISPTSTTAGGAQFTLTVTGTNFNASSTVDFNGSGRVTAFISSTTLTATITVADIAVAGTASITVVNPAPGGGTSNSQTFTINNPVPATSSVSPTSTTAGGPSFTLTVTGTNFNASSTIDFNGSPLATTFISSSSVSVTIPAIDIATAGTASITVVNSAPGGGTSNAQTFTINNPVPTLTSISPTSTAAGSVGFTLTLTGTNFNTSSSARWNGVARATTFVSSTTLQAAILTSDLTTPTTSAVTVTNPAPGGGTSAAQTFTVRNVSTSITINSSATSSIYGNAVTFTATVTPAAGGPPTGSVTFKDGAATLGTGSLNGANPGVVTFSTSTLSVAGSVHSITAVYGGDSNFTGSTSTVLSQTITTKALTVTGITVSNKVYDASTTATLVGTPGTLVGIVGGDSVSLTGTAVGTFATSSVGNGIIVAVSGQSLTGAQASNYSLTEPTTTANITVKNLTVTGITANAKQYDATTTATLNVGGATLVGVVAGDTVTLNTGSAVGTFATSSVGAGIAVQVSGLTIGGASSANYSLTQPSTTGTITVKNLTVTGITANSKTYDGNTTATLNTGSAVLVGVINGDTVTLNTGGATGTFATSSVGTGIVVTVSGLTISGSSSGNYSLTQPTTTANITNPAPATTSISPTSTTAGGTSFALTVNGTNFNASSTVNFNGSPLTTTFVSSSSVIATVPAGDITTAGTASVTVLNPAPGGGTSNAQTLTINNPVPTTTSISPTSTTAGASNFTLTVNGTNFVSGSVVNFNGSAETTTFVSANEVTATINASDVATVGTYPITVTNPTPGGGTSNSQTFTVFSSAPFLSFISPTSTIAPGLQFTLTLIGSNFFVSSTVYWNGSPLTTTYISGNELTATVPAGDITTAGTASVTVVTPAPGGGTSGAQTFTILNPVPTTTSLSPTSTAAGSPDFTLTVTGTNFVSGSSVNWNGSSRATTFISSSTVTATILASDVNATGTASITVTNPTPGGGTSGSQTFTVTTPQNPTPALSAISPTSTTAGSSGFTLTITGTGFVSMSQAQWDGFNRTTNFISSTTLTAAITASDISTGGTANVTVVNSAPGGGTSNSETFTTYNLVPSTTSISPTSTPAGSSNFTLTVTGTNFVSGSSVNWNGSSRATTFISSSTVTATILASDVNATGTASITVTNPTPGGGTSNSQTFTITTPTSPVPSTASINPTSTTAGSAGFTITVTGTNFISNSVVNFSGVAASTTFVSSNEVTAIIPASDVSVAGTFPVTVTNFPPGGGTSNAQTFTVFNLVPTTTSLSPTSTAAGSPDFTLTVNGTNFVSGSSVNWNGSSRATTFISSSTVTATILASDVNATGTALVTVTNPTPGGGTSNSRTFTVTATTNPVPSTTSLTPTSTAAGGPDFTLTVNGTNFVADSVVNFNGVNATTTFASSTQLSATIPAGEVAATGTFPVVVVTPAPGGGTSNSQTFTVTATANPVPTLVSISPTSTIAGHSSFTLTVTGTSFVGNSTVQWNGSSLATTFISSSTVTALVTAPDVASVGTSSVTVVNPTPGGGTSAGAVFTINAPSTSTNAIEFIFANVTSSAVAGNSVTFNIEAVNSSGTIDTSFEQGVTLTVSGSGTGGGLVTIVNGMGTSTVSDNIAQTVTLGLSDSQSTGLDVSATANVTFVPGSVAQFVLNHPGNMNVATRLGYTLGQEDQFGNPVSATSTVVYLYSNSSSTNAAFFTVATGGSPVTSVTIPNGSTSTLFWFYDDTSGSRTVTASDNSTAPDGNTGIHDTSDTFTAAPGAVKFIFANVSSSVTVGNSAPVNVYAVDSSNNIFPSYAGGVTVTTSGLATGGGFTNLVNGVGTTTVTDTVGETVTIGFHDTQNTGLGAGTTAQIVFNPTAPVSTPVVTSPTTGGGGGPAPTPIGIGIKPGVSITFSGKAYPGASVSVIRKDLGLQSVPVTQAVSAATDGSFLVELDNVIRLTGQTYLLSFVDKNGLVAQTKAYNIPVQDKIVYGNILAAPTLGFQSASVVAKGAPLTVTGYATPKATVELFIDGNPAGTVLVNDPSGKYTYPLSTDSLNSGRHAIWAIQKYAQIATEVSGYTNSLSQDEIFISDSTIGTLLVKNASGTYTSFVPAVTGGTGGGVLPVTIGKPYTKQAESDFSNQESFTISPLANPKLDLNGDGVIDIRDLSIFLSYLKSLSANLTSFNIVDPTIVRALDFNNDGVVNLRDLNILEAAISANATAAAR